jgi:adenylate cyclase
VPSSDIKQRLAAVLAADAVGFSRLMGSDERATLVELDANRALFRAHVEQHDGRVVDTAGDSILAVFGSAAGAVRAAVAVQAAVGERCAGIPEDRRMRYRIGVNLGDIIEKSDGTIYGDGVNVAARLQSLAEPGGILLSAKVHDEVQGRVDVRLAAAGEHTVKNIARPLRTYRVVAAGEPEPASRSAERAPPSPAEAPPALPDKPSIVVLPFDNMSGDKEQDYFADGITEDIITDISKVSGLFVIARNSSFTYKGKAVNLTEVGRELGVRHVLEGSVRKAGNRVRITAQLIDAASGGHLWAERYDRNLDDIFAVQDEVTREIVKALRVKLTGDEKARIGARATENLDAWDLFVRGRDLVSRHAREANFEARRLLSDAVALDGEFADAIALLAQTYVFDFVNRWSDRSETALDVAFELASRALELDDSRLTPHFTMAIVRLWRREHEKSLAESARCEAIDPNFPYSSLQQGHVLHYLGRSAEGIEPITRAVRHDPLAPDVYLHFLAQCHFALGDDEEAAEVLRRRITRNPETDVSRVLLAAALGHLGRHEEARREWARARAINPKYSLKHKREILPYRDPAVLDRMVEGLEKAGIDPE